MEKKTPMMLSDLIVELCSLMNHHGNVEVYVGDVSSAENPIDRVIGVGSLDLDRGDGPVKIVTIDINTEEPSKIPGNYLPDAEGGV